MNVPLVVEVHVKLEVPVPLAANGTLVEVSAWHVRPAGTVSLRATVPTKSKVLVKVIIDVSDEP